MDVISAVVATYIQAVSNTIHDRLTDQFGTQMQSKIVQYNDYDVSYSYQIWRIQPKSVCDNYSQQFHEFAACTVRAKAMFNDMCIYLQQNPSSGWRYAKTKNMYCNAATSFKPTIASVSFDEKNNLQKAEEKCSVAILKMMEKPSPKLRENRDKLCSTAETLRERANKPL